MVIEIKEKKKGIYQIGKIEPSFRDPASMTEDELTDPNYALKKLAKDFGNGNTDILTCSRCHHCR